MKTKLVIGFFIIIITVMIIGNSMQRTVSVSGYLRKDGTVVRSYKRSPKGTIKFSSIIMIGLGVVVISAGGIVIVIDKFKPSKTNEKEEGKKSKTEIPHPLKNMSSEFQELEKIKKEIEKDKKEYLKRVSKARENDKKELEKWRNKQNY